MNDGKKIAPAATAAPAMPADLEADECCQHQHRPGRKLAQRQSVDELLRCQPAELRDDLILDEGQHRQTAAEGECTDLEEEDGQLPQCRPAGWGACHAACRASVPCRRPTLTGRDSHKQAESAQPGRCATS